MHCESKGNAAGMVSLLNSTSIISGTSFGMNWWIASKDGKDNDDKDAFDNDDEYYYYDNEDVKKEEEEDAVKLKWTGKSNQENIVQIVLPLPSYIVSKYKNILEKVRIQKLWKTFWSSFTNSP
jgi:hypothetical protein